jgi:hypothetical protein
MYVELVAALSKEIEDALDSAAGEALRRSSFEPPR